MATLSVISSLSDEGDSLDISRACSTSAIRSPCIRCLPEILTLTIRSLYARTDLLPTGERVQVSFKIQIVIGMIRPLIFGDRNEFVRRDVAEFAVIPSQQGFETKEMSVLQIDQRLVIHRQLFAVDRMAKIVFGSGYAQGNGTAVPS